MIEADTLIPLYRDGLLKDVLPFWLNHALDAEHGGYFSALDRTGQVIDTDKSVWVQGRFAWLLATLYVDVEPRADWLAAAKSGIEFLRAHCFDTDGKMFFQVTREGNPLRKRERYVFSETFAMMAYAAYAKASGDARAAEEAANLFETTMRRVDTPGLLPPKVDPENRPMRGFGLPMILLNVCAVMRESLGDHGYTERIDQCIEDIRTTFINEEYRAVLEVAGPNGEFIDHFDGRTLNPGHAIEGAWFILNEARTRNRDPELIALGCQMLDWMWDWGWDEEFGGILYFRDIKGGPVQEYWHDMKFWWPQCEAIIATLLAYELTGDAKYAEWHARIHEWTWKHFPDSDHGEWYGYLHRDGRISHTGKGNLWKGPFHIPRMLWMGWRTCEAIGKERP